MSIINSLIQQSIGYETVKNYDVALLRLKCHYCDIYRGISVLDNTLDFQRDPLVFASRFCTCAGSEDILALASEDGKIALQDTSVAIDESRISVDGIQGHFNAIFDINWMPKEYKIVTASGDHSVKLWDANIEIKPIDTFNGHSRSVKNVVFRPDDSSVFASGARDGAILFWDIRARHLNQAKPDNYIYNAHTSVPVAKRLRGPLKYSKGADSITGLAFQNDNMLISCSAGDGCIKIWDLRKNYRIHSGQSHAVFKYCGNSTRNGFTSLAVCPSRLVLYANCMDNIIYSYNLSSYNPKPIAEFYGHQNSSFFIKSCLSPDGKHLMSGSNDEYAYIWRTDRPGPPIIKLSGHAEEVTSVAWRPYGEPVLATCCDDTFHRIWRVGHEHKGDNDAIEIHGYAVPIEATHPLQSRQESTPTTTGARYPRLNCTPLSELSSITPGSHASDADHSNLESPNLLTPGMKRTRAQILISGSMSDNTKLKSRLSPIEESSNPPTKRACLENRGARRLFSPIHTQDLLLSQRGYNINEPIPSTSRVADERMPFSPTENLPNFVIDGTAPHLTPVSPIKSKENVDWLTQIRQARSEKCTSQKQVDSNINNSSPNNQGTSRHNGRSRSVEVRRTRSPIISLLKFFKKGPSVDNDGTH